MIGTSASEERFGSKKITQKWENVKKGQLVSLKNSEYAFGICGSKKGVVLVNRPLDSVKMKAKAKADELANEAGLENARPMTVIMLQFDSL